MYIIHTLIFYFLPQHLSFVPSIGHYLQPFTHTQSEASCHITSHKNVGFRGTGPTPTTSFLTPLRT